MPPKTSCPVSLAQFLEKAEPLKVSINGQEMLAEVKQFSTGSFGWYMNGKTWSPSTARRSRCRSG